MFLAWKFIPLQMAYLPAWTAYSLVTGTLATGMVRGRGSGAAERSGALSCDGRLCRALPLCFSRSGCGLLMHAASRQTPLPRAAQWVVAHECGHGAFSDNRFLQDAVGYVFHSLLLVPYFSWQRSHAVHHARTNHLTEGETHCPYTADSRSGQVNVSVLKAIGRAGFTAMQLVTHLLLGWPAYILWGATGGSSRGVTNHFWPTAPFSEALWPGAWKGKVWKSDVGIVATLGLLAFWASQTSAATVAALYFGPYLVTNAWLVLYTWLQHTDTDIPHYDGSDWNFVRGAFLTVDRPYGPLFDFLHHRIGSTHVAHHVDSSIPHYHAVEATEALKKAFPHLYLYDPTPILCAQASPSPRARALAGAPVLTAARPATLLPQAGAHARRGEVRHCV